MRAGWFRRRRELRRLQPTTAEDFDRLEAIIENESGFTRQYAIDALGRSTSDRAWDTLVSLLDDEDSVDRATAARSLARARRREAWPYLLKAARDPDRTMWALAENEISRLAGPGDVAELIALADELPRRRGRHFRRKAEYLDYKARRDRS